MFAKLDGKAVLRLFVLAAAFALFALSPAAFFGSAQAAAAEAASSASGGGEKYFMVAFSGPVRYEWKEALSQLGAVLVYYVPEDSYVAKLPASAVKDVKMLPFVVSVESYASSGRAVPSAVEPAGYSVQGGGVGGRKNYTVVFFPGEKPGVEAFGQAAEVVSASGRVVRVRASEDAAESLALVEGVEVVESFAQPVFFNDNSARIMEAGTVWNTYLLNGSGQVIAVADSGIDNGTDSLSVIGDMNLDFDQRVVSIQNFYGSSPNDVLGHGTHVAGSAAGNGSNSNGAYRGVAWGAGIVAQAMGDDAGSNSVFPPDDLNDLFATAYASANGSARVHTNSWGGGSNSYTSDSNEIDTFAWNYKNMSILFAAGNSGAGGSDGSGGTNGSLGVYVNAKNAIVIGATESNRSGKGANADSISEVAYFSSRGPAADGRIKPDLVAPGTYIISSLSRNASSNDPCGWGNFDANYAYCGGTSMATPMVAGAAAVVRQYYTQNKSEANPSSALIKSTLINGAVDPGYGIPHNYTGWGRVNLTNSLFPAAPRRFLYFDNQSGVNTSSLANYTFTVSNTTVHFKVTLVWTDYPAASSTGSSKALVNNLDLVVVAPNGSAYFGNDFLSPNNDTRDSVNNVEQAVISPVSGVYFVLVNGTNVPQNPQPFALVVSGGLSSVAPVINSFFPANINHNVTEPANQTFNVTYSDADNDTVTVDWYVNGTIQTAARNTNFTFLGNFSQASQLSNGTYNITAVVSDGSLSSQLNWTLAINNTNRAPSWASFANQTSGEDVPFSFTVVATDLDNDTITYFLGNTTNFTINSSSGNITLNLSTVANLSGTFYLALNASDGLANASETIFVNITPVNDTPTLFPLGNITVNETDFANITAVANDGDNDLLNFTVNDTLRLNFTSKNQSAANFSWKTNLSDSGNYNFRVNVTDFNSSSIGFFNVTVIDRPDFDGDGNPDIYDPDDDNDGVADGDDSVLGNVTTINSSTISAAAFNVTVNSSVNLSRIFNGTFFVNVTNGTRPLVEFFWNFSQGNLSFNFTVDVQNSTAAFGGIIVKGLRLQQNQTKNITVQNVNSTINSTCIKDADVASLDNISGSCNGANETLVQCPGAFGGYNCSLSDDGAYYRITGANFTAAKEQCPDTDADGYYNSSCGSGNDCDDGRAGVNPGAAEVCGNGLDDDCSGGDADCPSTQASGSSGGGGGGGAATPILGAGTLAKVSQVFTAVRAGETAVMRINKSGIAFTKVRFTAAVALSSISMDVELLNSSNVSAQLLPPSAGRFAVYQYFRVTSKLTFLDISDAGIEFRVPKAWLAGSGFSPRQVALFRYSGGSWDKFVPVLFAEDGDYYFYSVELPAFSLFAVAAEEAKAPAAAVVSNESAKQLQNITVVAAANETAEMSRGEMAERLFGKRGKLIIAVVVAALLLFAVVFVINARRLKEREHISDELSGLFRKERK